MRNTTLTLIVSALAVGLMAVTPVPASAEGWLWVDAQGHCSTSCTPPPPGSGQQCPCYEMPPIIIEG
jgi:hypothetical protein